MGRIKGMSLALLLVTATACAPDSTEPEGAGAVQDIAAGDTVRLRVNQSARIGTSGVSLTFTGVGEDSRCPIDAVCVWPGTAEALLRVSAPGAAPTTLALHSFSEPRAADYGAYRIRLLEISPARSAEETIPPGAYVVRLEVTRR